MVSSMMLNEFLNKMTTEGLERGPLVCAKFRVDKYIDICYYMQAVARQSNKSKSKRNLKKLEKST